jgi:hypothetical protein
MLKAIIALTSSLCLLGLIPCLSDEESSEKATTDSESSSNTNTMLGYRSTVSAATLQYEGERALEVGDLKRALTLLKRSIDLDEDDCNTRLLYAKALETKLRSQTDRDPELFKQCVKEWLIVMRNEVGDQKGLGIHGISFLSGFYDDEEREMKAKSHLIKLTGSAPKAWETDAHYLNKVLRPNAGLVSGKFIEKNKTKNEGENSEY